MRTAIWGCAEKRRSLTDASMWYSPSLADGCGLCCRDWEAGHRGRVTSREHSSRRVGHHSPQHDCLAQQRTQSIVQCKHKASFKEVRARDHCQLSTKQCGGSTGNQHESVRGQQTHHAAHTAPTAQSLTSAPGCGMGSPSSTSRTWCRALIMWCSAPAGMASAKRCRRKTLGGASLGTIGRGRPPSGGAWSASRCVWGSAWRQRSVRR